MATIGTLQWAKETVYDLLQEYGSYLCKAETAQLTIKEYATKENLEVLSDRLDETLIILRMHESPYEKTDAHEYAEILRDDLDRVLSGLD